MFSYDQQESKVSLAVAMYSLTKITKISKNADIARLAMLLFIISFCARDFSRKYIQRGANCRVVADLSQLWAGMSGPRPKLIQSS